MKDSKVFRFVDSRLLKCSLRDTPGLAPVSHVPVLARRPHATVVRVRGALVTPSRIPQSCNMILSMLLQVL